MPRFDGAKKERLGLAVRGLCGAVIVGLHVRMAQAFATPGPTPWNYVPSRQFELCVDGNTKPGQFNNSRLLQLALPEGPTPSGGWPVMISLLVVPFGSTNGTSCAPPPPPPTPQCSALLQPLARTCHGGPNGSDTNNHTAEYACLRCVYENRSVTSMCKSHELQQWCNVRSKVRSYSPWAPPQEVLSGCFPGNVPGDYASSTACGQAFDPHAGAFWEQRYKQRLLDSDIAVLLISPYKGDTWDAYEPAWSTGLDRPFFEALFSLFNGGNTGPVGTLDRGTVFVQGWSAGAQMVSWLIESQFRGHLYTGTTIVGGLFMSGGSHACYSNPPNAIGVCADCDPTCGNEQSRRFLGMAGRGNSRSRRQAPSGRCPISTITPGCSSCNSSGSGVNNTVKPCCGYCCPNDFAEQYFADFPEQWPRHPPAFLIQMSSYDINADLCAGVNYHTTLTRHGVASTLVCVSEDDERCFCVGQPDDPAAAGAPYTQQCLTKIPNCNPATEKSSFLAGNQTTLCCLGHTMGFAAMVEPLLAFVLANTPRDPGGGTAMRNY